MVGPFYAIGMYQTVINREDREHRNSVGNGRQGGLKVEILFTLTRRDTHGLLNINRWEPRITVNVVLSMAYYNVMFVIPCHLRRFLEVEIQVMDFLIQLLMLLRTNVVWLRVY
jgi:hypothetical protein